MIKRENIIHNVHVVLSTETTEAHHLQDRCSRLFTARLVDVLDGILDAFSDENTPVLLDELRIDLGTLSFHHFERDMCMKLATQLSQTMQALLRGMPASHPRAGSSVSMPAVNGMPVPDMFTGPEDFRRQHADAGGMISPSPEGLVNAVRAFSPDQADARDAPPPVLSPPIEGGDGPWANRDFSGSGQRPSRPAAGHQLRGPEADTLSSFSTPAGGVDTALPAIRLQQLVRYLQTGFFAEPELWAGPHHPERWLLSLLASLSAADQAASGNELKTTFAQTCLYRRAKIRLSRTFSPPAIEALADWLEEETGTRPSASEAADHLTETALRYLLHCAPATSAPLMMFPPPAQMAWPASAHGVERWAALINASGEALMPFHDELVRQSRGMTLASAESPGLPPSRLSPLSLTASRHQQTASRLVVPQRGETVQDRPVTQSDTPFPASDPPVPGSDRRAMTPDLSVPGSDSRAMTPESDVPGSEAYFPVVDAGACLLWPLLPHLMAQLALTDNNRFVSVEARNRAVCYLDHLIWRDGQAAEWRTTFSRWLCGWDEQDEFDWYFPDEQSMHHIQAFMEQLLLMVPEWHRCQPDDLRAFFLQRPGLLAREARLWTLRPDESAEDILLQDLPWSLREIRLPWREDILLVHWI